jgi:cyclophilin family peptidyl-prolyl cis-trans isomerase
VCIPRRFSPAALNQERAMLSVKVIALCFVVLGMVAVNGARAANPVVVMETSQGTIKIELFEDKAPITVKNFLGYVKDKHYDGLIFHRVIEDFMIQGGGFEPGMKQKQAKDPIAGLDRANAADKVGYCVFGKVIEGMDVVDKIRKVRTGAKMGHRDVPEEDVVIKSVTLGTKG